jgi:hypothetical protein
LCRDLRIGKEERRPTDQEIPEKRKEREIQGYSESGERRIFQNSLSLHFRADQWTEVTLDMNACQELLTRSSLRSI